MGVSVRGRVRGVRGRVRGKSGYPGQAKPVNSGVRPASGED